MLHTHTFDECIVASLRGLAIQRGQRSRTGSTASGPARHPALTSAGLHGFPASAAPSPISLPPGPGLYQNQFAAAVAAAEQAAVQRQAVAVQQAVQQAQQAAAGSPQSYPALPGSYAATVAYARYYTAAAAAAASHQVNPAAAAAAAAASSPSAAAAAGLTAAYPFPVMSGVNPRDYIAEPYLGLAPVSGYIPTVYRNRFAPY